MSKNIKAEVGTIIEFICFNHRYMLSIKEIQNYKNYSWVGDLGYCDGISFFVHGDLDKDNNAILRGLAVQYDLQEIHGYIRSGIKFVK